MRPREVLAANLKALMGASPRVATGKLLLAATEGNLTNGTLDRIRRAESATTVDTLETIAKVFRLQAWQLLIPGLDVVPGEDGLAVVTNLPDWPFEMVDRERYEALTEPNRAYVQAKTMAAIEEREGPSGPRVVSHSGNENDALAARSILPARGAVSAASGKRSNSRKS